MEEEEALETHQDQEIEKDEDEDQLGEDENDESEIKNKPMDKVIVFMN